jgi:hypothetical protein
MATLPQADTVMAMMSIRARISARAPNFFGALFVVPSTNVCPPALSGQNAGFVSSIAPDQLLHL